MAEETTQLPTYKLGDTIRIELEVSDESGVGTVAARFNWTLNPTKSVVLEANGGGKTEITLTLEMEVTEDMSPGEYECVWVSLKDVHGNQTLRNKPGIRFRIEGVPGDHEGPKLDGWQLLDAGEAARDGRFFVGNVYRDLEKAKRVAEERRIPMFVVIYDARHPQKSKLDYSLGYFMEYQTTKNLVNENFVQVLLDSSRPGAADLVPADDPLENCRLVVLTPDGRILRSEGVYANPDEGLKRVRKDIQKWTAT